MSNNESNKNIETSLKFKTRHEKKKKLRKRIAALFIAAVVLVAAVSAFVLLSENDFDLDKLVASFGADESTSDTTVQPANLAGRINFLLVCSDDNSQTIRYMGLLCADLNTPALKLHLLSPSETVTADNYTGTFSEHFTYAGMAQLVRAVEESTSISVERYVRATDSTFKKSVKLFDGLEYSVPQRAVCELSGVSFIIESGLQTLTPDMLMRYMIYLSVDETNDMETLGKIICAMLDASLTQGNFERGESLFGRLSNYLDTDISVMDFTNHSAKLMDFISNENRLPAEPAETLEGF